MVFQWAQLNDFLSENRARAIGSNEDAGESTFRLLGLSWSSLFLSLRILRPNSFTSLSGIWISFHFCRISSIQGKFRSTVKTLDCPLGECSSLLLRIAVCVELAARLLSAEIISEKIRSSGGFRLLLSITFCKFRAEEKDPHRVGTSFLNCPESYHIPNLMLPQFFTFR